jgi:Na+/H+ antiporter NhaD/arsenite permease-like protein
VFLLLGMMVIISVMRETGIFEYLAIWAAKNARGRPFPLIVLLIIITAAASALLDNVTTVLLVAPVTILLCQRLALSLCQPEPGWQRLTARRAVPARRGVRLQHRWHGHPDR